MKRIAYQLGTLLFSLKLLFVDDCVLKRNDQLRLFWGFIHLRLIIFGLQGRRQKTRNELVAKLEYPFLQLCQS
jgi:hypothetical protein